MAKRVSGYVRSKVDGSGIPGINVSVLDETNSQAIPAGGVYGADANPVVTDANGYFEWESELSPGPLRLVADIPEGAEVKVRSGKETMQVGDVFLSDLSDMLKHWSFGVVLEDLVVDPLKVTPVTGQRQVRVKAGLANMRGYVFRLDTDRIITIDANTTLASRIDLVVLEQHVDGATKGRQGVTVIPGTVSGVAPSTNANVNIFQLPIGTVTVPLNATSVTATDSRIFSSPSNIIIPDNSVGSAQIIDGSVGAAELASNSVNASKIADGTVGTAELADNSVTAAKIAADAVGSSEIAANAVGTSELANGSVTAAKLAAGAVTFPAPVIPVIMKGRNDTDQDFSNTSTILTLSQSIDSGSYVWFAIGVARITGISYQGSLLRGWLRILMNGGEQGAEAFYMPGWTDDGDSVTVLANGTFSSSGTTPTFTLGTVVDGGGTLRVNQRQLMVFMMRTGA